LDAGLPAAVATLQSRAVASTLADSLRFEKTGCRCPNWWTWCTLSGLHTAIGELPASNEKIICFFAL
jgi:hypothetical protein